MSLLSLTHHGITLLQEDGVELARWTWAERDEALTALRDCGYHDEAQFLEERTAMFVPMPEQLRLPEAA